MPVLVGILAFVPLVQLYFGLVLLSGTAWISTAFLIGFLIALLAGAHWEASSPSQWADGLFFAIGISALVSVGLQLNQWLQLEWLELWSAGSNGSRPAANLGQPNQLATLLLWGLLSAAWGLVRGRIGALTALSMALFLLFGLALTGSRTGWIGVAIVAFASFIWRNRLPGRRWAWFGAGLSLYFALLVPSVGWLSNHLMLPSAGDINNLARISTEIRPLVWSVFLDAASQRPLFGYGWNQVVLAQLAVALNHPALLMIFSHSHNLFLDLVLWCGIPIGLFVSGFLVWWIIRKLLLVRNAEDAVLMVFLLIVGNHALWEFPLHYAYFLLPAGLVMGALDRRLTPRPVIATGSWALLTVWLIGVTLLLLVVRDYSRIEPNYRTQRLEWAHIATEPALPPEVLLLTQWREVARANKLEPSSGMSAGALNWMRGVIGSSASTGAFYKLATAMAMNNRPEEGALWLRRMCSVGPEVQCAALKAAWIAQSKSNPQLAAVRWPD